MLTGLRYGSVAGVIQEVAVDMQTVLNDPWFAIGGVLILGGLVIGVMKDGWNKLSGADARSKAEAAERKRRNDEQNEAAHLESIRRSYAEGRLNASDEAVAYWKSIGVLPTDGSGTDKGTR